MSGTTTPQDLEKLGYRDEDHVTVLHGWGRVEHYDKHYVDKVLFTGGVARDVPYGVAKHWVANTRPDGKHEQVYGKVNVHILPANAIEADFVKATGIQPVPMNDFAAMLDGVDLDALVTQMGIEKVKKLMDGLDARVPRTATSPYKL
jgi:anaerobic selenocysteine-containing dehydrogenase